VSLLISGRRALLAYCATLIFDGTCKLPCPTPIRLRFARCNERSQLVVNQGEVLLLKEEVGAVYQRMDEEAETHQTLEIATMEGWSATSVETRVILPTNVRADRLWRCLPMIFVQTRNLSIIVVGSVSQIPERFWCSFHRGQYPHHSLPAGSLQFPWVTNAAAR
jgi:hypothetical protein